MWSVRRFLATTRYRRVGEVPRAVEMNPTSFTELPKPSRTLGKVQNQLHRNLELIEKIWRILMSLIEPFKRLNRASGSPGDVHLRHRWHGMLLLRLGKPRCPRHPRRQGIRIKWQACVAYSSVYKVFIHVYAHIEIVVAFLVVNIISFLVITWQGAGVKRPY